MTRKALITGGCGFVGRHFTKALVDQGYEVTVVDDLSTGMATRDWPGFLHPKGDFRLFKTDVRDYFKDARESYHLIVHLAAVVGGRMTIEGDPLKVATDLAIDASFFNWLPKLRPAPEKVLFFSSSAAYPIRYQTREDQRRLSEDLIDFSRDIGVPDLTYGWSKLTGEFLAKQSVEKYGLNVVSYRPFSGYGEDQDFTYPFPSIVLRVVNRESPMTIWGSGDQTRDFIHIDDVVRIVMETQAHLAAGDVLNLATGVGTSFVELAKKCLTWAGHDVEIRNDPSRPEGVFYRVGDTAKQNRFCRPQISLEEGIERSMRYLSDKKQAVLL